VLGCDLGIVNLVTDSDGEAFSGEHVDKARERYHQHRRRLQKCGSKNAKRRLKKLSGKERRFQRDTNHRIAKHLIKKYGWRLFPSGNRGAPPPLSSVVTVPDTPRW
jgi:putative transposase